MTAEAEVFIDFEAGLHRVGTLRTYLRRGRVAATFEYHSHWLANPDRFTVVQESMTPLAQLGTSVHFGAVQVHRALRRTRLPFEQQAHAKGAERDHEDQAEATEDLVERLDARPLQVVDTVDRVDAVGVAAAL